MFGNKEGRRNFRLPMFGKVKITILIPLFAVSLCTHADVQIISVNDDSASSGTGAVTGVFAQVSAQIGDVIVAGVAGNKKASTTPISLVQTGGTGETGSQSQFTNGTDTYPAAWLFYQTVTKGGTFNFEWRSSDKYTGSGAIYVLRADTGAIEVAGSATWDNTDGTYVASDTLDYTFSPAVTSAIAIEAVNARKDAVTAPASHVVAVGDTSKRLVAARTGITGSAWTSTYTLSDDAAADQTSGAVGMVFAEGTGSGGAPGVIAPNDPNLIFQGSEYVTADSAGAFFQRHSDAVLALSTTEKGFNTQKAKTTTGISILFKTDSASIDVKFTHDLSATVENRNSRFGVYEDGQFTGSHYFSKTESNLTFTVNSASVFRVVLPNWSKPDFRGLEIDPGASLLPYTPPAKKKYVVFGDSISHGTGQGATYETYPWIISELLDVELCSLAVGGGKVSVPAAEMLSEFPPVDVISILIGYNDLHGGAKTAAQYETDLNEMVDAARSNQPNAQIFCISPLFTTNPTNTITGEVIQDFRQVVYNAVTNRQTAGDDLIYLIRGEDITSAADLNDSVHLSVAGAANFATNLFTLMDPIVNPPLIPQTSQTNFVFIVIDDLGWMDLSIQGSEFYETLRIDSLAAGGMRFTQGYSPHPRCLPARYGFMTGRFPGANGVPGGPENNLRPVGTTMAEALQANGYATCFAGKWHLIGTHGVDNLPQNQGFDVNFSGGKAGAPPTYFYPYRKDGTPAPTDELDKNALYLEEEGVEGEYITDRLTDEAIGWMESNADQPMFLCMWHYGVHTPFEAPQGLVDKYTAKLATMDYGDLPEYINAGIGQQKMRQNHPTYAAMIESVDTNIGRLMDKVEELGISSNTVFIFTSDNGGLSNRGGYNNRELATANFPLRTGKGWLYEGGIREAFIVAGAGVQGGVNSNAVVTGTDIYPTVLELAGLPLQTNAHHDGISFAPSLRGEAYARGEPVFWHSPQARPYSTGDFNSSAVRDGDYKLIWFYDTPGQPAELYNVRTDPGENNNLAETMSAKASELLGLIQAWHAGAHDGSGVIFRPDADDVAKPPQAWIDNPTVPASIEDGALSWGDYAGFNYKLWSRTNLLGGNWNLETDGITGSQLLLAMDNPAGFYKVEAVLEPEE